VRTPGKKKGAKAKENAVAAEGGAARTPAKRKPTPKKKRVDPMRLAMEQAKECYAEKENVGEGGFCRATLVVCPVVAAMQWRQEILHYTAPGELSACCAFRPFQGSSTRKPTYMMAACDGAGKEVLRRDGRGWIGRVLSDDDGLVPGFGCNAVAPAGSVRMILSGEVLLLFGCRLISSGTSP
jgi:hypothetical protein